MALVIGLIGRMGAGKGEIANYLSTRYGASVFVFSRILMEVLDVLFLPHDRALLQKLGTSLRTQLGQDVIVKALKHRLIKDSSTLVVVDGIRFPNEVEMVREFPGNLILAVDAPPELRFQRCVSRGEKGEAQLTLAQFQQNDNKKTEQHITELMGDADYIINNSGSVEQLHKKIDEIINSLT